jgi:hypothetical protein
MKTAELTVGERLIVNALRSRPSQTIDEIQRVTGQHREGIARHLHYLRSLAMIRTDVGPKGKARYSLCTSA